MMLFENEFRETIMDEDVMEFFENNGKYVNVNYIQELLVNEECKIAVYSINGTECYVNDMVSGIIYKVREEDGRVCVAIMFIATHKRCRGLGYASKAMEEFMQRIRDEYKHANEITVVLDSIQEDVTFYEHIGFKWLYDEKKYDEILDVNMENGIEHFIMEYIIKTR